MINKNNKKGFVLILSLVMLIGMSVTGLILLNIANDKVVENSIKAFMRLKQEFL